MIYKTVGYITCSSIEQVFPLMMKELNCSQMQIESVRITKMTTNFNKDEFKYEVWWLYDQYILWWNFNWFNSRCGISNN